VAAFSSFMHIKVDQRTLDETSDGTEGQSPTVLCTCVLCDSGAGCVHVRYCRRGAGLQGTLVAFRMTCFMRSAFPAARTAAYTCTHTLTHTSVPTRQGTHKTHDKRPEITAPTGTAAFILLLCGPPHRTHTRAATQRTTVTTDRVISLRRVGTECNCAVG
jgi:hypothetical protein